MLYLIGTGLYYLNDLPLRAIDELKKCDEILLERYTNLNDITFLENLEKEIGKKIAIVGRETMESNLIIDKAMTEKIAVLVPGDPLAATTHFSLIQECKARNIQIQIIHSSSIFSALGETGLSLYKFGGTTSIPIYSEHFHPESFFEVIEKNIKCNYHSLVLLEVKNNEEFVSPERAVEILKEIENKRGIKIIDWENVIAISKMGSIDQKIININNKDLNSLKPPSSLVIPGELNENEKDALKLL
ncbi:MAG: diphthine synthase [Candidatus Parvarchaeota archaeon]|nr:diphthine synthase [Candidatus Parvarchaeota archaeon]MCW1294335.1 diphthine synthase [Candidatus Parvarchaeum tengchongense]MCW1295636.1 diphthine synthase [Candidatus Parvarchaeum tengchongense]MCW1298726.1 diphthine synthase [Candidatus Parvarchaeum tengchongense]MCW1312391.1 diphthine synthase [Candidatus Parvarchaeum tengchongense]